ncbi:efflux RND transporter periplasmic adaptor subunit [bacterium]|nr:efflux RND transporter periplasmic adaptor subunit [bacterium]
MRDNRLTAIFGVISIILAFHACSDSTSKISQFFKGGEETIPVTVEGVRIIEKPAIITIEGKLEAQDEFSIKCESSCKISNLYIKEGVRVSKDDILIQLSEDEINNEIELARARLREAEALLDKNEYYQRNKDRLLEEGVIDQEQYDNLDTDISTNQGAIKEHQGTISDMERQLDNLVIRSPMTGVVTELSALTNDAFSKGDVMLKITNADPIACLFNVPADKVQNLSLGMPLNITIETTGSKVKTDISYIAPNVDPDKNTVLVQSSIPNPNNIYKSDMKITAEITLGEGKKSLLIPSSALMHDGGEIFVYVVQRGTANKTPVKFERRHGNLAEISSGLSEDDIVVVKGNKNLKDGTKVDIWGK